MRVYEFTMSVAFKVMDYFCKLIALLYVCSLRGCYNMAALCVDIPCVRVAILRVAIPHVAHGKLHETCMFHATR